MLSLSSAQRLRGRSDFSQVFEHGTKIVAANTVFYVCPNKLNHGRLGVIITKKAFKCAVDRNQVRRWYKEGFRSRQEQLKGYDVVVIPRRGIRTRGEQEGFHKLSKQWGWMLKQCANLSAS